MNSWLGPRSNKETSSDCGRWGGGGGGGRRSIWNATERDKQTDKQIRK